MILRKTYAVYSTKAKEYVYLDCGRVSGDYLPRNSSVSASLADARTMRDGYNKRLKNAVICAEIENVGWVKRFAKSNLRKYSKLSCVEIRTKLVK